jgi:DNA-binding beta-propeller fold protein YncE
MVDGPGTAAFAIGPDANTNNVIDVTVKDRRGRVKRLSSADVRFEVLSGGAGGSCVGSSRCTIRANGAAEVCYTITADAVPAEVTLSLSVFNIPIWRAVVSQLRAFPRGRHVQSLALPGTGDKRGVAVSADGNYMVVVYEDEHSVRVFQLAPFQLLHTIGRSKGGGSGQFSRPFKLCLTPTNNILVCDYDNNRVQEFTLDGTFVRSIPVAQAWCVALHARSDLMAVGAYNSCIHLLTYSSGKSIRKFGSPGKRPGQIDDECVCISFTPDGRHLLSAEYGSTNRISMWSVAGEFVRHTSVGVVASARKDIICVSNDGDAIVADLNNHRVCVLSDGGSKLHSAFGTQGTADGQFTFPGAIALVAGRLYVLDSDSSTARVQVFT